MDDPNERIRERAYQIWVEQGQPEGQEHAHWEQARREIEGGSEDESAQERRLDAGLDETFPSSDPASESQPGGGVTGPDGVKA